AGGKGACRHDVHRPRKTRLRENLPARVQEECDVHLGIRDKLLERRLEPGLDDHHAHAAPPAAAWTAGAARSISIRTMPTFTVGAATTTSTRSPAPTAQIRPAGASSCMNDVFPSPA